MPKTRSGGRRRKGGGVCPACRNTRDGEMICCETCPTETWYHYVCVDVSETDSCVLNPEECYSCPNCRLSANGLENVNQDVAPSQERNVNIVTEVSHRI